MNKKKLNFEQKLNLQHKISIKALDFEKLPKKLMSSNLNGNGFLNITRSSSNLGIENLPSSLSKQTKKSSYFVKPMTSRSRNDNVIKLNEIPKTTYINVTPGQKMKQLSRNNNLNSMFTQSIYQSYNNNSSAKCITFNTNNSQHHNYNNNTTKQFGNMNILNKMTSQKGSSRNMSNPNILVNNSTYSYRIKSKDSINITSGSNIMHKFPNNLNNINNSNSNFSSKVNKNSAPKTLLINGYKSGNNGTNFRGTISNFGSLSYKKFGIRVKKKKLLNRMDEQPFLKDKIRKLSNLELFKNFDKLKTFILWREYTSENENIKRDQFCNLDDFINQRIINYYYKNKLIRKYNQIKKEEQTWKKLVIPRNSLEINEYNKGSILISLCEHINNTLDNTFFNSRIKNYNEYILYSVSLYIFELMINQIFSVLSKVKYIFKYYYDEENKIIIKKPSAKEIKNLLLNINKIVEKPNITNKTFQEFIINLSRHIANLNLNKTKVSPIISQYLDLYMGKNNINIKDIKISFQFENIFNDFSSLQIKDANFIINDIKNLLNDCENHLIKYYLIGDFDDNDNFFILLYKIQPIKYNIMNAYEKMKNLMNKNDKKVKDNMDEINDIQNNLDNLNKYLNKILNEIEGKYNENLIDGNVQDIKIILPYLIFQLIKNNIIYKNLFEGISKLETNRNYLSSKKNKDIFNTYNKLYNNGYIDFDYILYLCLYDKYLKILEAEIDEDISNNRKKLYKILIYLEEMLYIYNKINIFEENKLTQTINLIHNNVIKNNDKIDKLKKIVINYKNTDNCTKNKNSINELYQDLIFQHIKYDINNNINKNTSVIEKILFKQLTNKVNNNINIKNNEKELMKKIKKFNDTGDAKILRELYPENRYSKKFLIIDKNKKKEITYPYPHLLLLPEKEISSIAFKEKISLNEISKYYNMIHEGQELEIKGMTMNKNVISGVQIYDENRKESEIFKFCNPMKIPVQNKNSKNTLNYLSLLYKSVKAEIESSLTKQLMQSLNMFSKKDFHDWVNSTFNQVTICTLCLIFTHEISKLLISENNNGKMLTKDYKLINERYNNFLTDECTYINCLKNRINVILTIISQMNIIETLIKNDVHDINSFNWLKYIRHLWDKNKKSVIIECGGWANYQMKKIIKYRHRLLLSPDTDKIFLFNSSCFREKSASIIKVINNKYNNNSYREIFDEYCYLFWTDMIYINLFITPNEDMKRIFDVCTTDCSWIYMENLDIFKYNNDNNCINNLVYFSKFIQTIQQEVILNDIKSNEGEKMFCLMGCLNVDDNIKTKCECLKGSSRILNFIKPDIDFYINISFQVHKYINKGQNNIKTNKNLAEILLKNEQIIREKLNGFYFDFDYFNEFFLYLLKTKYRNIINLGDKLEDLFIQFIKLYSNKFLENNERNCIDDNVIIKYFENKKIVVDNERIQLMKYLFFITQNNSLKVSVLVKGYSKHFMINVFKNFYFSQTNQKLNESDNIINGNINIIYHNEYENKDKKDNYEEINGKVKIINLFEPKSNILLKIFFSDIIIKLKKINYLLSDKYEMKLINYIFKVIKNNSKNTAFYRTLCNFNNWMNKFIDIIGFNKKRINDIIIYNIISESLIVSLGHEKNRIKSIIEYSKENIDPKIYKQLFDTINKNCNNNDFKYFYYDIDKFIFRSFENNLDYIKSYKQYIDGFLNNTRVIFIFSDFFGNENAKELNNIFDDDCNQYFITNEIDKLFSTEDNSTKNLKIFSGYDKLYINQNIQMNILKRNEKISKIIGKVSNLFVTKYLYALSKIDFNNYSYDELLFIYHSLDSESKEIYIEKNIHRPLKIIKDIANIFPKAKYYINLDNNKLLKHLFINKILIGVDSINFNEDNKNIIFKSNNIFLNLSEEICIKIFSEILSDEIKYSMLCQHLKTLLKMPNNDNEENEYNYITDDECILLSKMICDIYNISSETSYNEKYQSSQQALSVFKKLFYLLGISQDKAINDNYYNCRIIIQFIKYGSIKEDSLNYKCLSSISDIFNKNSSKINDISILINETLTNYKELISNKNEFINTKYYYFKQMKISAQMKENIYNSILEKIYLSMSNHFLFSLLMTLEIMLNNFEISFFEKRFLLNYLKNNYIFPSNNVIKYKFETESDKTKLKYIKDNGKNLIEFYTQKSKSIDNKYLTLLNKSLDNTNNKYFYTSSLKQIDRDIDKLLYYITFVPEQSSSMFKYIINKYLLKIITFSKFNINDTLRKPTTKENLVPITVNAFPSINVINFLCSLSAYYEITFYIIRNTNIYEANIIDNVNYGYQYLIDGGFFELIKEGMKKGYWILVCEKVDIIKFMKILWELYNNLNEINVHKNFKIFFDEKLIEDNCQKAVENNTTIININSENVDDLEAAHDIWVNVLEEKILTDSVMNQTQKDVLEMIDDSSVDKTNLIEQSINNTGETKKINTSNMGNSIISIKSIYNNSYVNNGNNNGQKNNLSEITNWTFLKNI